MKDKHFIFKNNEGVLARFDECQDKYIYSVLNESNTHWVVISIFDSEQILNELYSSFRDNKLITLYESVPNTPISYLYFTNKMEILTLNELKDKLFIF